MCFVPLMTAFVTAFPSISTTTLLCTTSLGVEEGFALPPPLQESAPEMGDFMPGGHRAPSTEITGG